MDPAVGFGRGRSRKMNRRLVWGYVEGWIREGVGKVDQSEPAADGAL